LTGKNTPGYAPNKAPEVTVTITNASHARIHYKKLKQKEYQSYSGYPGGRKAETMQDMIDRKGHGEVFRNAVYGMLPANKLRNVMMKHLTVSE
ncbi:uL13 family ribosomal protein, partial [candidate division KSB1 bacterium]|nr:uL13 family ribosomal protein [candidate division KSB1 bacterium]NIW72639.1 50S ribosomal protein L13 [candidate division KSB1 bacterium]NIX74010.1 50S ribosomal protein L13 [candidate division KSB1 bacterium]